MFRVVLKIDSVAEIQFVRVCGMDIDADAFIVCLCRSFVFCLQYSGVRDNDVHTSVGNKELVCARCEVFTPVAITVLEEFLAGPAGLSVIKTLTSAFRDPLMSKPIAPPAPHSLDAGLESSGALRTESGSA